MTDQNDTQEKSLQSLIAITSAPARLDVNFDALAAALRKEVARYEGVVVTLDTVTEARKLAAELNAVAGVIDRKRKDEVAKASEPVRAFDARMKDLAKIALDEREKIQKQIEACDDATREEARRLMAEHRAAFWSDMDVAEEFRKAAFDDLVMVSAVTKAGSLAGKQKTILENRCRDDKQIQDRTERRLLELENASYKAGLAAPLTRDHVRSFLFDDNDHYSRELERILTAEVERQEQAERAMRERLEREARQKAEAEERERKRKAAAVEAERAREEARKRHEQEEAERSARGKCDGNHGGPRCADPECWQGDQPEPETPTGPVRQRLGGLPRDTKWEPQESRPATTPSIRRVVAQFQVEAPAGVSDDDLVAECRRVMEAAGITTLTEVYVVQGAAAGGRAYGGAA